MNNDLCKYMFQHFENAYNVGWNTNQSAELKRNVEIIDEKFLENLSEFCKSPLNKDLNGKCREIEVDGKKYVKGFAEIRVLDIEKRIRYAAPNIILDDIIEGNYIPPIDFVKAVKNGPKPSDFEYKEFLLRYTPEYYWGEDEESVENISTVVRALDKGIIELRKVIESGDIINCVTNEGSLLNCAIEKGKTEEAMYIMEAGIDINAFAGIELLNAIKRNMTEVAEGLIERHIHMENDEMSTNPLISAIRYNNTKLVLKLLDKSYGLIRTYSNEYVRNCTILDVAQRSKNKDIINIVKEHC